MELKPHFVCVLSLLCSIGKSIDRESRYQYSWRRQSPNTRILCVISAVIGRAADIPQSPALSQQTTTSRHFVVLW